MRILTLALAATLLLSACSGGDDDASPTSTANAGTAASLTTAPSTTANGDPTPSATQCAFFPIEIYRLDVATGFTTTIARGTNGTWSPNSSYFAYTVPPGDQSCGQGLNIDAAVSHQRQFVVPGTIGAWAWAHDSTSVAVSSYDGGTPTDDDTLSIVSVPSAETQVLVVDFVAALDWAPDSHAIAYANVASPEIRIHDLASREDSRLPALTDHGAIVEVAWSPSGDRIAALTRAAGGTEEYELYIVSLSDSAGSRIASHPGASTEPRFSPDGSLILYETFDGNDPSLYVLPADGSAPPTLLAEGAYQATWSPDGSLIAYVANWCQSFDIAVIAPDGTGQAIVSPATEAGVQLEPTWSPDGTLIAFHSDATYTVHPDGTNLTRVADSMEHLAFSPDGRFLTGQSIGGRDICVS